MNTHLTSAISIQQRNTAYQTIAQTNSLSSNDSSQLMFLGSLIDIPEGTQDQQIRYASNRAYALAEMVDVQQSVAKIAEEAEHTAIRNTYSSHIK